MTSPARWSRGRRFLAAVAAGVVALNLVALALERTTGGPGGPRSSSFATAPEGLAAYADLLARSGHAISRLREDPRDARLPAGATVVVLDPGSLADEDAAALRRFAEEGGRLVAGGTEPGDWLGDVVPDAPAWEAVGDETAQPLVPVPEVAGVQRVAAAAAGSWSDAGGALPVLGGPRGVLLAVTEVGDGRAALLADPSPLQNRFLGEADNAALGVALAGGGGRPVLFVESVHGYGAATGLRALPRDWLWALGGLGVAALAFLLARGRRLGPPEREGRAPAPPRREYVESLAGVLARSRGAGDGVAPVQAAGRERLARRAGLPPDADAEALVRAAARLGLPADEAAALTGRPRSDAEVLAAGRALARLESGSRDGGGP